MKKLHLIRHAKSSWKDLNLSDLERPLKEKGIKDIHTMSQEFLKSEMEFDMVLTSPALRAFETSKIIVDALGITSDKFKVKEKLYLPDFATLLKSIIYLNDNLDSVAIVGHEPSLSTLINYFINKPLDKVGTGSITTLGFESKRWINISASNLSISFHRNRHDFEGFDLE